MEDCFDLSSDHSPIILTLSETIIAKQQTQRLTNKNTDWDGYRFELEQKINLRIPLKNQEQLDSETENFTNIMQQAAWNNTPKAKSAIKSLNYPIEISEKVNEKQGKEKIVNIQDPKKIKIFCVKRVFVKLLLEF